MGMKRRLCKKNHNSIHTTEPTSELLLLKVTSIADTSAKSSQLVWYLLLPLNARVLPLEKKNIYILLDSSATITKLKHLVSCIGFLKPILWAYALASRRAGIFSLNSKSFCNQQRFRKWKFIDSKVQLLCNQIINKTHNHF